MTYYDKNISSSGEGLDIFEHTLDHIYHLSHTLAHFIFKGFLALESDSVLPEIF